MSNYRHTISIYIIICLLLRVDSCLCSYLISSQRYFFFLFRAALLRAPRRPLPGGSAGPAAQRPLPVWGERRGGGYGGGGWWWPVPVFPSPPSHHSRAQLLALRRQPPTVASVAPDRRARQRSRWLIINNNNNTAVFSLARFILSHLSCAHFICYSVILC